MKETRRQAANAEAEARRSKQEAERLSVGRLEARREASGLRSRLAQAERQREEAKQAEKAAQAERRR